MVANLTRPPNEDCAHRIAANNFEISRPLEEYITSRSKIMLNFLTNDSKDAEFLVKDPSTWADDQDYLSLQRKAHGLKVVNDCAERGISLIEKLFDKK